MPSTPFVAVLLYPGCIFFEIALAAETLASFFPVRWYTPDGRDHVASNGSVITATDTYQSLRRVAATAVLVPGGDPGSVLSPHNAMAQCLHHQATSQAVIASICAGNLILAHAGLLVGRRGTHPYTKEHAPAERVAATAHLWKGMSFERADVVQDGQIVTAQPWAYREFAATVARALGLMDAAQADAWVNYKERRSLGPRFHRPSAATS